MNNLKKKIIYLSLAGMLMATGTVALASEGRRGGELRRSDDDGARARILRIRDLTRRNNDDNRMNRGFDDSNLTRQEKINLEIKAGDDKGGLRNRIDNSGRRTEMRSLDDSGHRGDDFGLREFDDRGGRR